MSMFSGMSILCIQAIRSVCDWSGGQDKTEYSIHQALVDTIRTARHYIYIENQFFISFVKDEAAEVKNDIATEIFKRIVEAHRAGDTFRVFILIPLLPAFEGNIAGDSGAAMRAIMYYQYRYSGAHFRTRQTAAEQYIDGLGVPVLL